jgi:hypothetical protein
LPRQPSAPAPAPARRALALSLGFPAYDVIVTSLSPAELEVRPYIVLESIGQKQIWKSAPPLEPSAN